MDATALADIARRHRLRLVLRYGSTLSGIVHAGSDLDIAVMLAAGDRSLGSVGELGADLQRLSPDREVDLAVINHADPLFLKKIVERCEILFGTGRALAELRMYAYRRYQDHRRFLALERPYVERTLERLAAR